MKEHVQKPGVRKWAGEDLIELQGESLTAIQALVEPYAPCVIQGCEVSHADGVYQVQPGIVALKGSNEDGNACTKIVRFAGYTGEVLPIYLTVKVTPYMRVYADEENKPIAYEYTAESSTTPPVAPYLMITATGAERLVDTIGITQKLDREGGNASNVKVVSFVEDTAAERSNVEAGSTLKELFGKIRRWFASLKALAFKDKVSKSDFDDALTTAFNNKVDKVNGKGLSTEDFTTAFKDKLDNIANNANNYTHPTSAGNKHIPSGGSTGQYLKYSSAGTAAWATPTASEIGAAASSHSHNAVTQNAAGFMSATDKSKLDGIASGANNYTHPNTAGNKHIPAGGSSGQYLKYSAAGTAAWASPASNLATTSAAGFMSAADKKKVSGAYIYYMARVQCSTFGGRTIEVYNPDSVIASFSVEKVDGNYCCKTSIGRPTGYTYAKPMILGESSGAAWIDSHTGGGSFNVYIMNGSNIGLITQSTFTIVMIAHN